MAMVAKSTLICLGFLIFIFGGCIGLVIMAVLDINRRNELLEIERKYATLVGYARTHNCTVAPELLEEE